MNYTILHEMQVANQLRADRKKQHEMAIDWPHCVMEWWMADKLSPEMEPTTSLSIKSATINPRQWTIEGKWDSCIKISLS